MGRTARGVRGIKLAEGDYVKGVCKVEEGKKLLTITENGFGKRSEFDDFNAHNRGTKGVTCHNINEKTGMLTGIAAVDGTEDIMFITDEGTIIRTDVGEIPVYSRSAGGVIVMRIAKDSQTKLVHFATVEKAKEEDEIPDEEETETEATPEAVTEETTDEEN